MKCTDNNRAETVLELFESSVAHVGLPSCVRADRGGENVGVASYMLEHPLCGPGRASLAVTLSITSASRECGAMSSVDVQ